ncbi:FecCD family ABC transporter permease [Ktedonosporobacter rubrisoli]|nr:iron ABC transporter permease [Ktedonosporobacter rubrisoli]
MLMRLFYLSSQFKKKIRRFPALILITSLLVFLVFTLHIALGSISLSLSDTIVALFHPRANALATIVIWHLRLPRTLIGLMAGAMFGLAGVLLQCITRNPLAEPGTMGITSGSILMIVAWFSFLPISAQSILFLPLVAFIGGLGAGGLIYILNWYGKTDPLRLALLGVVVNAVLQSGTVLLLIFSHQLLDGLLLWLIGSLNGRTWDHWAVLWPWAVLTFPLAIASAAVANALSLGDEVARGLGLRVEAMRVLLFLLATLLAAAAISAMGGIAFIGLIGPHIARKLVGSDNRRVFLLSPLLTAGLLLVADIIARLLLLHIPWFSSASTLPVGVVTALLGAPFFLYLSSYTAKRSRQG